MSKGASALPGAVYEGFARVEELGLRGMVTLRGDLKGAGMKKALDAMAGLGVPGQREVAIEGARAVAWMSPDELLVMLPHGEVDEKLAGVAGHMDGAHHLAVNVSDARAVFRVSGPGAREVIAKLAPVDLSKDAFGPGTIRRTRLAQVPAALWMEADGDAINVICFRSVAQYVFDILKASAEPGSEVGYLV